MAKKKITFTFPNLTPDSTPKEVRKEGVKRLRSGEYKKCIGELRRQRGNSPNLYDFCVMGVFTDLALKAGVIKTFPDRGDLLPEVQEWVGFTDREGSYTNRNGQRSSLISRNDSGASFKKLAEIIEREPTGLIEEEKE